MIRYRFSFNNQIVYKTMKFETIKLIWAENLPLFKSTILETQIFARFMKEFYDMDIPQKAETKVRGRQMELGRDKRETKFSKEQMDNHGEFKFAFMDWDKTLSGLESKSTSKSAKLHKKIGLTHYDANDKTVHNKHCNMGMFGADQMIGGDIGAQLDMEWNCLDNEIEKMMEEC